MRNHSQQKQAAIRKLCQAIETKFDQDYNQQRQDLAKLYFAESIPKEFLQCSQEHLLGAISSLWQHIYQRQADEDKVFIYHPSLAKHGWASPHTVIDIICKDRPFMVSSITNALVLLGYSIHITTHPVLAIGRDPKGQITSIRPFSGDPEELHLEAVMRFEIDHIIDLNEIETIHKRLLEVMNDVRLVVDDWHPMRNIMLGLIDQFDAQKLPIEDHIKAENMAFLRWTKDNNFTFMGYRYYELQQQQNKCLVVPDSTSGLGLFRADYSSTQQLQPTKLSPYQAELAKQQQMLVITKSTSRSSVQRPVKFDYLGVKQFDKHGEVIGEHRFFGLYSSAAYIAKVNDIPILRHKVNEIKQGIHVLPTSHKGKSLEHILNHYPRDEMLQAPTPELLPIVQGILETHERNNLRLFIRTDKYGRFVTALVYVPRERFHTKLRMQLQDILMQAFNGNSSEFSVFFGDQTMARVHITIHGAHMYDVETNTEELEHNMRQVMLSWQDHLLDTLQSQLGFREGAQLWRQYEHAFPLAYQENYKVDVAVKDLASLQHLTKANPLVTHLYETQQKGSDYLHFKVFGIGQAKTLSDVLPILEHMGVKVISARPYVIKPASSEALWMIDFAIQFITNTNLNIDSVKEAFQAAFAQAYSGRISSDRFNGLVLSAGLSWREAELMRAISAYLHQIQVPFSKSYTQTTLNKHAHISRLLISLFKARFDPESHNQQSQDKIAKQIYTALDQVSNLNEDRIIKYFLALINATLRCNYYQTNNLGKVPAYLALKIDPLQIPDMPLPAPKFEIFVFSTWVEGVHLRGGKVARGGLRWSDRHEDYRTEVLGLVKAQMVKNAVIVPLGAKGGFVCKQLPENGNREELMAEVTRSYSTFIQALLDLTDNIIDQIVTPPTQLVRYDDDDPYLVVAADKGTATFSDIANAISTENNFWLDDAFASGGANGYDHKKMGITARGAWESVKRLFAETGHDCQQHDFSVIGVGDMGGDVFGNGMLLSKHICLQAAFNHLHIFVDPKPNASQSFKERQRLFKLPRSSWADYNSELISNGGGVFSRHAKYIELSPEMQSMLNTQQPKLTPNELIHSLLKMPVDLFWNGGIGTYVKASSESHNEIGDPANDTLRVNGDELGARIVGEGGNLGCSQAGRIEYAQHGGLINTDAIDNSGGVDSSDHEVNIKILLGQAVASGDISIEQRNTLLASMTDEVADLVLDHNYHQSLVLSIAQHSASRNLHKHKRLIQHLESLGRLNRSLEGLPSNTQIDDRMRQQEGLTRPEIAVLLAYSKMHLFDELMASDIAHDDYLSCALNEYFPQPLNDQFANVMANHPLRAEIICTHITNQIGNRMGASFLHLFQEETAASAIYITRAFVAACHILQADSLWAKLDQFTLQLNYNKAIDLYEQIQSLIESMVYWLLKHHSGDSINSMIDLYIEPFESYATNLAQWLPKATQNRLQKYQQNLKACGLDNNTSAQLSQLAFFHYGLDIACAAKRHQHSVTAAGCIWFRLYSKFRADWLSQTIDALPSSDTWQRKAQFSLQQALEAKLTELTAGILHSSSFTQWEQQHQRALSSLDGLLNELQNSQDLDLAKMSVAVGAIADLQY